MTTTMTLQMLALFTGMFCILSGIAFFLAGLLPGPSGPWWKQYGWAAFMFTAAYLLLPYGLQA